MGLWSWTGDSTTGFPGLPSLHVVGNRISQSLWSCEPHPIIILSLYVSYWFSFLWRLLTDTDERELTSFIFQSILFLPHTRTSLQVIIHSCGFSSVQFSSVSQLYLTLCNPMNRSTPGLPVHHQLPEFTQTRPSSQWCHPAIPSSVVPFTSCPQSLPASGSFPMSQLFAWSWVFFFDPLWQFLSFYWYI